MLLTWYGLFQTEYRHLGSFCLTSLQFFTFSFSVLYATSVDGQMMKKALGPVSDVPGWRQERRAVRVQ